MKFLKVVIIFLLVFTVILRVFFWNQYITPYLETPAFWKEWYMKIYYPTYTRLDGLVIGVLIGYLFQFSALFKTLVERNGNLLVLTGILAVAFSLWFCRDQYSAQSSIFGFTLVAVSYGILVAGAVSSSSFLSRKPNFLTSHLAVLSYSIYLSHKSIIHIMQLLMDQHQIPPSGNLVLIICFLACLAVGLLYRYIVEKPSALIKNKISNLTIK